MQVAQAQGSQVRKAESRENSIAIRMNRIGVSRNPKNLQVRISLDHRFNKLCNKIWNKFDYVLEIFEFCMNYNCTFADVVSIASEWLQFVQFANDISRGDKAVIIVADVQVFQTGVLFTKLVKLNKKF